MTKQNEQWEHAMEMNVLVFINDKSYVFHAINSKNIILAHMIYAGRIEDLPEGIRELKRLKSLKDKKCVPTNNKTVTELYKIATAIKPSEKKKFPKNFQMREAHEKLASSMQANRSTDSKQCKHSNTYDDENYQPAKKAQQNVNPQKYTKFQNNIKNDAPCVSATLKETQQSIGQRNPKDNLYINKSQFTNCKRQSRALTKKVAVCLPDGAYCMRTDRFDQNSHHKQVYRCLQAQYEKFFSKEANDLYMDFIHLNTHTEKSTTIRSVLSAALPKSRALSFVKCFTENNIKCSRISIAPILISRGLERLSANGLIENCGVWFVIMENKIIVCRLSYTKATHINCLDANENIMMGHKIDLKKVYQQINLMFAQDNRTDENEDQQTIMCLGEEQHYHRKPKQTPITINSNVYHKINESVIIPAETPVNDVFMAISLRLILIALFNK